MDFLIDNMMHVPFWLGVVQIIGVNMILSGDNAVVIALACMKLPPRQRLWGMILGAGVAVLLRVFFTLVVAEAMTYPYLKLVGGVLLFWVAVKLVIEDADGGGDDKVETAESLWRAVRIVAIADIIMSLDNVIAIASSADIAVSGVAAAHAPTMRSALIIFGLATSVPLIVAGSAILMALLERFRALVWAGGALLGWIVGDIMITDPAVTAWIGPVTVHTWEPWAGRLGAIAVVGLGLIIVRRHRTLVAEEIRATMGLFGWLLGDIAIDAMILETESAKHWIARAVLALVLMIAYAMSRRRSPAEVENKA